MTPATTTKPRGSNEAVDKKAATLEEKAQAALSADKYEEAVGHLNAALFLLPNSAQLLALRGEALLQAGDLHSSIFNFRRSVHLSTDKDQRAARERRLAQVMDVRAAVLVDHGAHAAAIVLLSEALSLDPECESYLLHRALAHMSNADFAKASRDLQAFASRGGASADAHFLRGKLLLMQKDLRGARLAVDNALSIDPKHQSAAELLRSMDDAAKVYSDEATKLSLLGAAGDAVSNLTHAMELRPHDVPLRIKLGLALRQEGKLYDAVAQLEEALAQSQGAHVGCRKSLSLAYNDVGVLLASEAQLDAAVEWFHKALSTAPDGTKTVATLLNRADCLRQLERPNEALADYQEAARLSAADDPDAIWAIQARMAVLHNDSGARLFNHTQPRKAALAFSRAIECNPRVAMFYVNRAEATLQLRRYELAKEDVLAALRLDPSNSRARALLAGIAPS